MDYLELSVAVRPEAVEAAAELLRRVVVAIGLVVGIVYLVRG